MTLFHEKMTLLFGETPGSVSDWLDSAIVCPELAGCCTITAADRLERR